MCSNDTMSPYHPQVPLVQRNFQIVKMGLQNSLEHGLVKKIQVLQKLMCMGILKKVYNN